MQPTNIFRIADEDRATSSVLTEWEQQHASGRACVYRQPWFSGIPWEDKCMGEAVVVWDGDTRLCARHALSEGPPEWFNEAVEVSVLPDCPPETATAVRARESVLRDRAEGTVGFDWRAALIAEVESWAARDGAHPGGFSTGMAVEPFAEGLDPAGAPRRVRLALAGAIAERRRLAATNR